VDGPAFRIVRASAFQENSNTQNSVVDGTDMLLKTQDLTKHYDGLCALDRLSLEIAPGEVFGLLGPNGSGKSTTLRLLLGFIKPTSGHAAIAGHDCWHDGIRARRHASYLPGELRLYENMTGRRLIAFLSHLRNKLPRQDLNELARSFDIDLDRPIAQLSSGMKRKLALLQVLIPKSPLIILDEPTNTLDPTMRSELLDQLKNAGRHGQAVLFSSHVLSEVEHICDRVGILRQGQLVHVQKMSELRQVQHIEAEFEGPPPAPPDTPGLQRFECDGQHLKAEYSGFLPALLSWLAQQGVRDLRVQPLGLAPVYRRYHGNNA
jgi:ABC-2 type transport system ATP-binding protein